MYRIKKAVLTIIAAVFLLPAAARAEIPEIGLQEAFTLALRQNPKLVAMENAMNAGKEKIGSARGHLLPRVTLEERYMRTNNPTYAFSSKLNQGRFEAADFAVESLNEPDDIDNFITSISLEQPLYSREASLGVKMARTASKALELDYRRGREGVLLDVLEAFISGETARNYLEAARKGLEDARAHLDIARSRVETGLGLESDLLRAEVSVRESEERIVTASKGVMLASRSLGLILGEEGPWNSRTGSIPAPELRPVEYYEETAMQREDLQAMASRVQNARLNLKMSSARFSPVAGLGGSYQIDSHKAPFDEEGNSYQVAAFVRWDLYSGGRKGHEISDAAYGIKEAQSYYDGLKKEIIYRVNEAYLAVEEASRGMELAASRLSLAEETARLIEKRYENSLATVVELLDAQSSLDSARANLVARTNSRLLSLARLMFQSGLIQPEYVSGK